MKTLAKIVGALIALLIVAALAAPMFINQDTIKAQLVAQVKKATDRTLEIKGETSVTLFPNIAVSAEDVTLSNPEGFTTPYLVSLKKLATGAELMPLLRGELIVNGITLEGANINLEELASGAKNWEFTAEKVKDSAEKAADAPEAQESSKSPLKRFALGDVEITDGAVNIIKPGAKVLAVSDIDLTVKGADANSPLELDGSAVYREEKVAIALDIENTRDFLDNKLSPLSASLSLPGATANFEGEGRMGDSSDVKGKLSASTTSLPKVMSWATGKAASPNTPKQVALDGNVAYMGTTLKLSNATVRVDSATGEGSLSIDHGGAVPDVKGNLAFSELDLNAFAAKKENGESINAGTAKSSGWSSEPIDLSALKSFNADLGIAWQKLVSGKFTVGPTKAQLTVSGGKLDLTIKESQFYSGALNGTVRAGSGGIGANIKANGIDIESLVTALSGKSRLQGKTNLALDVTASGNSQQAWVNSLGGKGTLKVLDGALKGINIGSFLRNAKQGNFFKNDTESTDFSELTASYTIHAGVLTNNDLAMKSPALRVTGSGSANLPAKTINYRLVPTLAETSRGQGGKDAVGGITVPLVITGSWSNPSVTPDLAGILEEGLKNPEKLKENIEGFKSLLGGKKEAAPTATTAKPTTTETAPAVAPKTKKEERQELIEQGIGGLLQGLGK